MQVKSVNRKATQNYGNFVSAMDMVLEAFDSLDKVIADVDDNAAPGRFTVRTKAELQGFRTKAFDQLERLRANAKKYEADLVSRPWGV